MDRHRSAHFHGRFPRTKKRQTIRNTRSGIITSPNSGRPRPCGLPAARIRPPQNQTPRRHSGRPHHGIQNRFRQRTKDKGKIQGSQRKSRQRIPADRPALSPPNRNPQTIRHNQRQKLQIRPHLGLFQTNRKNILLDRRRPKMKKPGLKARRLPGSVTAIRRPNIPKYL